MGDICENRHKGNANSRIAYKNITKTRKVSLKSKIVAFIVSCGDRGATVEEIQEGIKARYTTVSARCSELKKNEVIEEKGERETTSGSPAAVLFIKRGGL